MNARSLQSVLVLLAQILGSFGQTWVFYKFGWVFYKFTEDGEFLNRWFLLQKGKNRDACRRCCSHNGLSGIHPVLHLCIYYQYIIKSTRDPKGKGFWLAKIAVKNTIMVTNKKLRKLIGNDLKTTWDHLATTLILLGDYLESTLGWLRDNLGTSFLLLFYYSLVARWPQGDLLMSPLWPIGGWFGI